MLAMNDEKFLSIIDATPLVSVDLIVKNTAGEVLLGKRLNRPAQSYWFVPGGRIRKNETIDSAIRRISQGELGVEFSQADMQMLGGYDHIYDDNYSDSYDGETGINTHYVVLAYAMQIEQGLSIRPDQQHEALSWWPLNKLMDSEEVHQNSKNYFLL